jgi:hypothetical protein
MEFTLDSGSTVVHCRCVDRSEASQASWSSWSSLTLDSVPGRPASA